WLRPCRPCPVNAPVTVAMTGLRAGPCAVDHCGCVAFEAFWVHLVTNGVSTPNPWQVGRPSGELPSPAHRARRPRSPPPSLENRMRHLPFACRAFLAATVCSAVVVPIVLTPTAAWAESPEPSACSGLYHGDPPGSLAMTTSPSSTAVLHPGDEVEVTATWDTADWPGPVLHKVLDCLLVN